MFKSYEEPGRVLHHILGVIQARWGGGQTMLLEDLTSRNNEILDLIKDEDKLQASVASTSYPDPACHKEENI